jgi:hypothetical protein
LACLRFGNLAVQISKIATQIFLAKAQSPTRDNYRDSVIEEVRKEDGIKLESDKASL